MEELKKVNDKIEQLNDKIKQLNEGIKLATLGTGEYKNISDEKCSKILVLLEAQLADFKLQLSDLKADKERWFKLIEEERKGNSLCFKSYYYI